MQPRVSDGGAGLCNRNASENDGKEREQSAPKMDAFMQRTTARPASYKFGMLVRRRQLPGEPGDRGTGRVLSTNLVGDRVFVEFKKGKVDLVPADELEPARQLPIRARERKIHT